MDPFDDELNHFDNLEVHLRRLDQLEHQLRAEIGMDLGIDLGLGVVQIGNEFIVDNVDDFRQPMPGNLDNPLQEPNPLDDQPVREDRRQRPAENVLIEDLAVEQIQPDAANPAEQQRNPVGNEGNVGAAQPKTEAGKVTVKAEKEDEDPILTSKGNEMKGLSCMICYDPFNTGKRIPKSFPCGHTFCLACVGGLMKNRSFLSSSTVICPTCRQNTRFSINLGAEKVPTNFCLLAMLEQRNEEKVPKIDGDLLECKDCHSITKGTELTICNEDSCQNVIDEELLKDCDVLKRAKCLLICHTCIKANHARHNYIPFGKVVAQYEVNQKICAAEAGLEKGLKSADDTLISLKLVQQEVLDHRKRMVNALENIRSEADHPQIFEYLNRYTSSVTSSGNLFKNFIGDINLFDNKSKARYYRAFGTDMLRPISITQNRVIDNVQPKEEPKDDAVNQAPRVRVPGAPRAQNRLARFNVFGPFQARNVFGNNAGDANPLEQALPMPNIDNIMNRVLDHLDVGMGLRDFPPLLPVVAGGAGGAGAGAVGGAGAGGVGNQLAGDPLAILDGEQRQRVMAVRAPVLPRRLRRNADIRAIRQNLMAAVAANPELGAFPAIQNAIDGLRENRDLLDDGIIGRRNLPQQQDQVNFARELERAEDQLNRLRDRLNRLERLENVNQREAVPVIPGQNAFANVAAPAPWVDEIVEEPLAPLPPIDGIAQEVVQRAEVAELVRRVLGMVRNEANAEAAANGLPPPELVVLPPLLNHEAIPGVPDYNNLMPIQVAPYLVELRALELEWIQKGRDRRARAANAAAAPHPVVQDPVPAPAEPMIIEQLDPVEENEIQAPALVVENNDDNRDLANRAASPASDEPAAKRNRQ